MLGPVSDTPRDARRIACMEVWGGNEAFTGTLAVPGHDIFIDCHPCGGAAKGGDVYYVSNCAAGRIARVALADVSGHGLEVSDAAIGLRDLMRRYINTLDQRSFAQALNRRFRSGLGRFATAVLVSYDTVDDRAHICNAGHPPPLWYEARRRVWRLVDESHGNDGDGTESAIHNLPLGVLPNGEYTQFSVGLSAGDILVLYSDAFLEASGLGVGELGTQRLLRMLDVAEQPAPHQIGAGIRLALEAQSGAALADDATMIVLRHHGGEPPVRTFRERLAILRRRIALRR